MSLRGAGLASYLEGVALFEEAGLDTAWCAQRFGVDALTMFAVAGASTSRIAFGTSVIPAYSRHPLVLASQALTTQAATGGRLRLGIGSSHRVLVEGALGLSYEQPATHLREYLSVLGRLLAGEEFAYQGAFVYVDTTTSFGAATVADAGAPPVYVGTMFPRSLRAAGELADGVATWLVGPRTLAEVIVPTLTEAASEASRARPKVVAGLPVAVCSAAEATRQADLVNQHLARFVALPVYEKVLAREGATGPADLAAIGDEETVAARLLEFAAEGVDEVQASCFGNRATYERTARLLGQLARSND